MKKNIFKYLKFISIAAFSGAMLFGTAFGACAFEVDIGTKGMTNVGAIKGVTTISSDDTSGVNLKFVKYKSLFKTLNIRKANANESFIEAVEDTDKSINFQAYPAYLIAKFVQGSTLETTGYQLGANSDMAVRHAAMCDLIDHVPAGTYTDADAKTPSPVPGRLSDWNFYDWALAWSGNKGILDTMLGTNEWIYAFLDTKIDLNGNSIDGYSAVYGTGSMNHGANHWKLDLDTNILSHLATWEGAGEWMGLIGKGQDKKTLFEVASANNREVYRHVSKGVNAWQNAFWGTNDVFRMGDMRYNSSGGLGLPNDTDSEIVNNGQRVNLNGAYFPFSFREHKLLEVAYLLCEAKQ